MRSFTNILCCAALACTLTVSAAAQTRADSFLIEPNRAFVYLHVVRMGLSLPAEDGKRHELISVSYTHLDVYKRQKFQCPPTRTR